MKKIILLSALVVAFGISLPVISQTTTTTNCPGVPGACGFPSNHSTTRNASGSLHPTDGSGTLGNTYNVSKCGLNYIAVSQRLGQRFTPAGIAQPAPFTVNGLQVCDSIEKAYLWVEGSGAGGPQTATIQPPSGPTQNFPLTLIGSGPDKCWSYPGTVTYRADVTSIINGNGVYNISGLNTSPPMTGEDMDGATLVIIYSDHMATYQGTLVIDDGCIEVSGGVANYDMNYAPVCGATTNAKAFCCVGDIQFAVQSLSLNGTPAAFAWDWWNYVETPTTVNLAQSTSNYNLNTPGDCFNLCVVGLYYQTTSCAVCPLTSPILSVAATSTPSTCPGCNGTATATPTPAGVYTYSWFPGGQTTQTATNLCAGIYTVSVTGGCLTQTTTVTVQNTGALIANPSQTNVNCFQGSDGTATVVASGGTGPYTYSWAPSGGNAATASGLAAGTYTCTTTDANGCVFVNGFTITEPVGMTLTTTVTNVLCNGQSNGSATVSVTGGSPSYTYAWSPTGGTTATVTNLSAGQYTCTITDANGCVSSATFTIVEPPLLTAVSASTNVSCNGGSDGSGTVSPSGGTGPYTYQWLPSGGSNQTANGLSGGNYTITVTDAHGCIITQNITVTQPSAITIATVGDSACAGQSSTISATGSGGIPPYTYAWSNGPTTQSQNITIGSTTTFTVTVTDANSCVSTATTTVTVNPLPIATIGSNSVNGVYTLTGPNSELCFTGPTAGIISWQWDLNGVATSILQNPCVPMSSANIGQYCAQLVVVNNHNCVDTADICLDVNDVYYSIPNVFTPDQNGTNDAFMITNMGMKSLRCEIYNRWGELIYEWDGTTGYWDGKTKSGNEAVDGTYYYTVYMQDFQDKEYNESGFIQLIRGK